MQSKTFVHYFALFFLLIFFTKLAWYDIRTLYPESAEVILSRLFLFYSVAILPFIAYLFVCQVHRLATNMLMLFYLVINIYGFIWGVTNGFLNTYLLQDTFKLLFVPSGYLLAWMVYKQGADFEKILWLLVKWAVAFTILRFAIHMYLHTNSGLVYGTVQDLLLIPNALYQVFLGKGILVPVFGLGVLGLILFGQKRTLFALTALGALWVLSLFAKIKRGILQSVKVLFVLLLVVASGLVLVSNLNRVSGTTNTLTSDVGESSKRLREVVVVLEELAKGGPARFFAGYGSGAYFYDPVPNPATGSTITHSVHFTPAAMVYRYGFLGILLYLFSVLYLIKLSLGKIKGVSLQLAFVVRFYMIGAVIMSQVTYAVVDDVFLGFLIGVIVINNHYANNKREPAVRSCS